MRALQLLAIIGISLSLFGSTAVAEDWPQFRGPTGQGISQAVGTPVKWGPDENVVWKTPIPGSGWSSPVVVDNRIYLTTALSLDDDVAAEEAAAVKSGFSLRAMCFDAETGLQIWDTEVFQQAPNPDDDIHTKNSHASSTPIVDGNEKG